MRPTSLHKAESSTHRDSISNPARTFARTGMRPCGKSRATLSSRHLTLTFLLGNKLFDSLSLCSSRPLWLNEVMKFGVIIFPGSNCDHDSYYAAITATGQQATMLWHDSRHLENCDAIIVPGGFAYGDYLRTGAIARFAPIMQEVAKFAASGGLVIGICNGFQILCEAGLLPGALLRNAGLKYICKYVHLRVENSNTPFTNACQRA